jgi:hypothetical protein
VSYHFLFLAVLGFKLSLATCKAGTVPPIIILITKKLVHVAPWVWIYVISQNRMDKQFFPSVTACLLLKEERQKEDRTVSCTHVSDLT